MHELAHNKVADHPPEFKILNSKLNAQLEAFERAQENGTHSLIEGEVYEPSAPTLGSVAGGGGGHRLGGAASSAGEANSVEERRQRILMATMRRLEKEEQEIESSCGSAATAASSKGRSSQ